MLLLLDSSGQQLCCAAASGGEVHAELALRAASEEARDLAALCRELLQQAGAAEFTAVAAGLGPGSFIGTRVAVSFANGFAAARGMQLCGFNSVAALLPSGAETDGSAVIRDARREQAYLHLPQEGALHVELLDRTALLERLAEAGTRRLFLERTEERPGRISSLPQELTGWCTSNSAELQLVERMDPGRALQLLDSAEMLDYIEPIYLRGFL